MSPVIPFVLVGLSAMLFGGTVGWFLRRRTISRQDNEQAISWETRLRSTEREIEKYRDDIRMLKARNHAVEAQLARSAAELQVLEATQAQLALKQSEIAELNAAAIRTKKSIADLKEDHEFEIENLGDKFTALNKSLTEKDAELLVLQERLQEIDELNGQLATRDARIFGLSTSVRERDGDIERLTALAGELEGFKQRLAQSEIDLSETETRWLGLFDEKSALVDRHEARIRELEPLVDQMVAKEQLHAETENAWQQLLAQKNSEIAESAARLVDFEQLQTQLADGQRTIVELNATYAAESAAAQARVTEVEQRLSALSELDHSLAQKDHELAFLKQLSAARDVEFNISLTQAGSEFLSLQKRIEEIAPLRAKIRQQDDLARVLGDALTEREEYVQTLATRLDEREAQLREVSLDFGERERQIQLLTAQLTEREAHVRELTSQLSDREAQVRTLMNKLEQVLPEKESELARLQVRLRETETQLARTGEERESRLREIEEKSQQLDARMQFSMADMERLQNQVAELEPLEVQITEYSEKMREVQGQIHEKDAEISWLLRRLNEVELLAEPLSDMEPTSSRDELERVYGIGPVLEKVLNQLGVYTYRQMASWSSDDIERIDGQLDVFKGRIRRENWIEAAREEHFKKYGELI